MLPFSPSIRHRHDPAVRFSVTRPVWNGLARHHNAFIRPSPSRSAQGGVSTRTREAIALCEAAGFDTIIIETIGVGQSEILVSEMSDIFVLILSPAGGDELQGVKRGVIEISDFVLVNKADGDLESAARQTCAEYAGALRLLNSRPCDPVGVPMAMTISAKLGTGLEAAWKEITALAEWRKRSGFWDSNRVRQAVSWFESEVDGCLLDENPCISRPRGNPGRCRPRRSRWRYRPGRGCRQGDRVVSHEAIPDMTSAAA